MRPGCSKLAWLVACVSIGLQAQVAKGPDAFGYTATNGAAASFRDISVTGIRMLQNSEDGSASITPDFTVKAYSHTAAQICVGVNGVITIGGCNETICPNDDPATFAPVPDLTTVMPFWGDLSFDDPRADAVYYETIGAAPDRQFIVQWNKALDTVSGKIITFQTVFSERTGAITFQYLDFGSADPNALFGASAFIGIRDAGGNTNGNQLKWSFNADVVKKRTSIQFSVPNTNTCPLQISAESASVAAAGGDQTVTVKVPNGCPWTASTNSSWIAIASGVAGSGDGSVVYSVLANQASTSRQSTLMIGGKTVAVAQAGVSAPPPPVNPPPLPRLAAAEQSITLEAMQGIAVRRTIVVTAESPVAFSAFAQSDPKFISIVKSSGSTPGTVELQADATGLAPGEYTGNVHIDSYSTANSVDVKVTFIVKPLALAVSELALELELAQDATPVERTVSVLCAGKPLSFTAGTSLEARFLSVSPEKGSTPATLKVTVNPAGLAPGSYTGVITLTPAGAEARTITVKVKITAGPPRKPVFAAGGFVNGASFALGAVAPGGIVSIFGSNLAPMEQAAQAVPLPTTLAGVSASVNGVPAPLFYVSPGQVNLQVPFETAPGKATVTLSVDGVPSEPVIVDVAPVGPGIFMTGENRWAAALNQDYKVNGPENPAEAGQVVMLFLTGLGELDKPVGTGIGAPLDSLCRIRADIQVTIGGKAADVAFAGLAPGFVGLYQVNVFVPELESGNQEVVVTVAGVKTNSAILSIGAR